MARQPTPAAKPSRARKAGRRLAATLLPALMLATAAGAPGAPAFAQEQRATAPKQTIASLTLAGEWWAPDFGQVWTFVPDARGGVAAHVRSVPTTTSLGFSIDFDPAADGRRLLARFQNPADVIRVGEDGQVVITRQIRPETGQAGQTIRLQRLRGPAGSDTWTRRFLGRWTTNGGVLTFTTRNGLLEGRLERTDANGAPALVRRYLFLKTPEGPILGAWAGPDGWHGAEAAVTLAADGASLHGTHVQTLGRQETWSARKLAEASPGAPGGPSTGIGGTGGGAPDPAPLPSTQGAPPAPGFKSLGKYDVRLDRVVSARDAQRTDVFLTVRNASGAPLYVTSGALQITLEDQDGVAKQNGAVYRPSEVGREHFASTPVLQPGRELRVKYAFHPDANAKPARVSVAEGDRTADFPAS